MFNRCLLVALLLLIGVGATAQKRASQATITNIKSEDDGNRLKVTYTLQGIQPADSVYLQIESRARGVVKLNPAHVTGNVGTNVTAGPEKIIFWDYKRDGITLDEYRATVIVKPAEVPTAVIRKDKGDRIGGEKIGGGPGYALLSAALPGVGNIFVQPNRKVGFRPLVTASYVGLLAYGIIQRGQSRTQYDLYEAQADEASAQPYYDLANQYHQRYYIATRAAAAIMLTDVAFTLMKGLRNQKLRKSQSATQVSLRYLGSTPALTFQHQF